MRESNLAIMPRSMDPYVSVDTLKVAGVDAIGSQGFVQVLLGANLKVEIELKFGGFN